MSNARRVAAAYWRAETRRDLAGVMAFYGPGSVFRLKGRTYRGPDEIRTFYEQSFSDFPGLEIEIVHEISGGDDEAALEWQAVFVDPEGGRHSFRGANCIRVKNGLLHEVRPYFETALPQPENA